MRPLRAPRPRYFFFSLPAADTETAFYPDVIPGEWGSGDIYTAADGAAVWDGPDGRPAEGPVLIDSQLYYAGADGYFLKNAYSGSLFFDSAGRYTSGNAELDGYVLAALREAGTAVMRPWRRGSFACSYARYERLRRLLEERGARVEETLFGAEVEIVFSAPETQSESVVTLLRDATAGEAEVRLGESVFRPEREKE